MTDAKQIADGLAELDEGLLGWMIAIGGCSDSNCIIVKPIGMHTNGGCRCNTDKYKMARTINAYKSYVNEVRALLNGEE